MYAKGYFINALKKFKNILKIVIFTTYEITDINKWKITKLVEFYQ